MGGRCCSKTQTAPSPQKTELRIRPIADQQINRITVHVVQARNLPIKDVGVMAKSDPYVKVTFQGIDGAEYRTDHIRAELNPVWNASFIEEGEKLFGKVEHIRFDVYDHDQLSKDEWIGGYTLPIQPKSNYSSPVQWVDLLNIDGEVVDSGDGGIASLQIGIRYEEHIEDLSFRSWTDVLELTIKVQSQSMI